MSITNRLNGKQMTKLVLRVVYIDMKNCNNSSFIASPLFKVQRVLNVSDHKHNIIQFCSFSLHALNFLFLVFLVQFFNEDLFLVLLDNF